MDSRGCIGIVAAFDRTIEKGLWPGGDIAYCAFPTWNARPSDDRSSMLNDQAIKFPTMSSLNQNTSIGSKEFYFYKLIVKSIFSVFPLPIFQLFCDTFLCNEFLLHLSNNFLFILNCYSIMYKKDCWVSLINIRNIGFYIIFLIIYI